MKVLRERREDFDIVLSDVHMPDMDGFKLLEHIGLELDVPVMMMSANCATDVVLRGIIHGAVDYLLKPVRIEELRNIWQHMVRKKRDVNKDGKESSGDLKPTVSGSSGEGGKEATETKKSDEREGSTDKKRKKKADRENGGENGKHGEGSSGGGEDNEDSSTLKKPRVVWSAELHQQFVSAVNQLGIDKAVPKRILDLMGVQGLTRENVASHLQKYRLYLKRLQGVNSAAGGPGGGAGFMTGLAIDGSGGVMGPGGTVPGRVGAVSPAVNGVNGVNSAPGTVTVMGGPIDPSSMGAGRMVGQPQPMHMGMMYGAGPHMGQAQPGLVGGPDGMKGGPPAGQMQPGQPYMISQIGPIGGPQGGMGQPMNGMMQGGMPPGPGMGGPMGPMQGMPPGGMQQMGLMQQQGYASADGNNGSGNFGNMTVISTGPGGMVQQGGHGRMMMVQPQQGQMMQGGGNMDGVLDMGGGVMGSMGSTGAISGNAVFVNNNNGGGSNLPGGDIGDDVLDMFLKDGLPDGTDGF